MRINTFIKPIVVLVVILGASENENLRVQRKSRAAYSAIN